MGLLDEQYHYVGTHRYEFHICSLDQFDGEGNSDYYDMILAKTMVRFV